jgi:hypothetical protein
MKSALRSVQVLKRGAGASKGVDLQDILIDEGGEKRKRNASGK